MKWISLTSLLFFSLSALATKPDSSQSEPIDTTVIEQTSSLVAAMDSMMHAPYFEMAESAKLTFDTGFLEIPKNEIPTFSDSIVKNRLDSLNLRTPFNVVHNDRVEAFINLYAVKRREQVSRMLGLSEYYFPMFEEVLDQHDVPLELKYLAVVESALNPRARSHAGAVGMWQFMYSTGKMYDLEQNSYMDERMDPVKSTHAAAQYLKYLYRMYDKWDLALAAYNCGPGNVNRAMRRSGSKDGNYWDLYPFLPRETRGYVPAFIAAYYVFEHADEYKINRVAPLKTFFETDTVHVKGPIFYSELSSKLDLTERELSFLNPAYKRDLIPAYSDKTNILRLPREKVFEFYDQQDTLIASTYETMGEENDGNLKEFEEDRVYYRVRSGDVLGRIAQRYGVRSSEIMRWNNLRSSRINIGQRLVIYPKGGNHYAQKSEPKKIEVVQDGGKVYYQIQSGDTLWDIAKARGISVSQLKELNKNVNYSRLKPGMKIVVGTNG
ncbi:MAG: transglycosylase SLT domain-containing protein [Salibacter sp.]|uniref:lytic transglycosylase domain-containing protein n=1 Tax=Salibacter sp. TaxID=2010995 RepID=UPI002870A5E0|nr:transglycosylase SLT domain-containing protein [Salibacter sp.]MDR9397427.1 transglycosylase SLT domain-containing protein [Salibacter sp.]